MVIAVTGATGFLGRYIVNHFLDQGRPCRCWYRHGSDRGGFRGDKQALTWIEGGLEQPNSIDPLLEDVDAVIHAGLHRPPWGTGHRGADTHVADFAQVNIVGTLRLIEAARRLSIERFVFISTCGVHDVILPDRSLDETHPLWPLSHYGAHKAAIEKFIHSFGLPHEPEPATPPTHHHLTGKIYWGICALRPCGIYGLRRPLDRSKWYQIVLDVLAGHAVDDASGGKEVHAEDVARTVEVLLQAPAQTISGQSYHCCDLYVAAEEVAKIAKQVTGSPSTISRTNKGAKHLIDSQKIRSLGMRFKGRPRLEEHIGELIEAIKSR